ncbi:MAG: hypothetical protein HFJ86_11805 [Oscillospiraceae bacterium]|jgi:hypothetical protein|nr:hypothetical protein [Oscillospiraceae bacterium]
MKRKTRLAALLLCLPLLFCGCGEKAPETEEEVKQEAAEIASRDFVSGASIEYGGLSLRAQIAKDAQGETTVSLESPETLKGLTLTSKDGEVALHYKGLSTSIDPDSFVGKTLVQAAIKALNQAGNPQGISVTRTDGGVQLISSTEGMEFTLALDQETGHFLELSVPDEKLNIKFENFQFADPKEEAQE